MVTLRFELGDDHDRQYHVMLIESRECIRVSEQDARVEDVGTTLHRVGHAILPWAPVPGTDAADRTRRSPAIRGQTCRTDRGCPLKRAAPALSRRTMATGGPPRGGGRGGAPPPPPRAEEGKGGPRGGGGPGNPPATTEGTRVPPARKEPWECLFWRGQAPKRRLRSEYERKARRKSTLRNAGQYASQK